MIVRVIEKCEVDNNDGVKGAVGLREVDYDSDKETLPEALDDYENNFDFDKIIDTNDDFPGECQSSEIISIEILEK